MAGAGAVSGDVAGSSDAGLGDACEMSKAVREAANWSHRGRILSIKRGKECNHPFRLWSMPRLPDKEKTNVG